MSWYRDDDQMFTVSLTKEMFAEAYILLVGGAAKLKDGKEVEYKLPEDFAKKHHIDDIFYITFPELSPAKAIVRRYHDNGNIWGYEEYENGLKHGKCQYWFRDGKRDREFTYAHGKRNGSSIEYNRGNNCEHLNVHREWKDDLVVMRY